jgi:hypothetical protein
MGLSVIGVVVIRTRITVRIVQREMYDMRQYRFCHKRSNRIPLEVCIANAKAGKRGCVGCMRKWRQGKLLNMAINRKTI